MFRYLDINSYFQKVGFAFRALKSPNFRLFFYGQTVSLLGTFIQNLALGWLIYRLTDSSFLLGVVGFAGQIPSLILTPFAGVYADRLNRRKVLVATQTISMVMAFLLAFLFFTDRIDIWHIIVISIINGMSLAFDTPFRHAFLLEMVGEKELLQNAIALNSTLINAARFIGPTLGGFLIAWLGEGYCFLTNGISFMAVIASLLSMKVISQNRHKHKGSITRELLEGLQYSFNFKPIRYLILFVVAMGFFGLPFQVFLPVFAKDILHGDSQMLGYLTGSMGAGALLGAFYLASRKGMSSIPRIIFQTSLIAGAGLVAFSLSTNSILSIVLIFFTGFGMIAQFAATNTLLQQIVDDDKRGRVVALYGMSFMGITPLGSLLLGTVSPWAGVQITLVSAGIFCLIAAIGYGKKIPIIKAEVCE
ncbi:MAG: MFS transporter [Bacteroidales bacterium]